MDLDACARDQRRHPARSRRFSVCVCVVLAVISNYGCGLSEEQDPGERRLSRSRKLERKAAVEETRCGADKLDPREFGVRRPVLGRTSADVYRKVDGASGETLDPADREQQGEDESR